MELRERVARWLSRYYWKVRGNDITDEMENEFWLSFVKDADRIISLVRASMVEELRREFVEGAKWWNETPGLIWYHEAKAEAARRHKEK